MLDVATGTGDLALELARRVAPGGEVVGSDFSQAMLTRARAKAAGSGALGTGLRFEWADALALPYPDAAFDAATVGFGARNFSDLRRGLAEMVRVVRPGGRVVVLEITVPTRPPLSHLLRAVVRPRRAVARTARGGPRRVHLPAELGQALPRARDTGRRDGSGGAGRDPLRAHRRRHHRHPRRHGP